MGLQDTPALPDFTAKSFPRSPRLDCDVIMKGGITSGVIYPWAVCELAQTYRLRSVGGASAGAIAAAAAAAAELGRASDGFVKFAAFPQQMNAPLPDSTRTVLFGLFQPSAQTRRLFELVTSAMDRVPDFTPDPTGDAPSALARPPKRRGALRLAGRAFGIYRRRTVLGALLAVPALVTAVAVILQGGPLLLWAALALGLLGLLAGLLAAVINLALGVLADLKQLTATGFGMCTGMPQPTGPRGSRALTPWLHERLQDLAGRVDGPVLTFGDLERAGITLRMMTTDLSTQEPLVLPWARRRFFFDRQAMRDYFPDDVVRWLEGHPPALPTAPAERFREDVLRRRVAERFAPLPDHAELPVIVATRMSLSFPFLISAVPLHLVDSAAAETRAYRDALAAEPVEDSDPAAVAARVPEPALARHWFTDGGLCSNLPVHFFDNPLPKHPTFAINLSRTGAVSPDEALNSTLPTSNSEGYDRAYSAPAAGVAGQDERLGQLIWFARSLLDTARNWVDEAQLVLPGYRDRVVQVLHTEREGGLNLAMPQDTVSHLSLRGRYAARRLSERFAGPQPGRPTQGMDNQRWVRFRAATAALGPWLDAYASTFDADVPGANPYWRLLGMAADGRPELANDYELPLPAYRVDDERRPALAERVGRLVELAREWSAQAPTDAFTKGRPRPLTRLRAMPYDETVGLDEAPPPPAPPVR